MADFEKETDGKYMAQLLFPEGKQHEQMVALLKNHCGIFAGYGDDVVNAVDAVEKQLKDQLEKIGCLDKAKTILTGLSEFFLTMLDKFVNDKVYPTFSNGIDIAIIPESWKNKSDWDQYGWMNAWCEIHMDNTIKDIEFFEIYYLLADFLNFPTLQFLAAKKIYKILSTVKIKHNHDKSNFVREVENIVSTVPVGEEVFSIFEEINENPQNAQPNNTECLKLHALFKEEEENKKEALFKEEEEDEKNKKDDVAPLLTPTHDDPPLLTPTHDVAPLLTPTHDDPPLSTPVPQTKNSPSPKPFKASK